MFLTGQAAMSLPAWVVTRCVGAVTSGLPETGKKRLEVAEVEMVPRPSERRRLECALCTV